MLKWKNWIFIDKQANVRIKIKERKKSYTVKIKNLEKGLYYIRATLGDFSVVEPLIIQ